MFRIMQANASRECRRSSPSRLLLHKRRKLLRKMETKLTNKQANDSLGARVPTASQQIVQAASEVTKGLGVPKPPVNLPVPKPAGDPLPKPFGGHRVQPPPTNLPPK